MTQRIKHLPAMRETLVQSLGWEDPLEKEMTTHSSILAWRIPCTEKSGWLHSTGSQRVGHDFYHSTSKFIKLCDLAIKICVSQLQCLAKETRLLKPILLMGTKRKSGQILH